MYHRGHWEITIETVIKSNMHNLMVSYFVLVKFGFSLNWILGQFSLWVVFCLFLSFSVFYVYSVRLCPFFLDFSPILSVYLFLFSILFSLTRFVFVLLRFCLFLSVSDHLCLLLSIFVDFCLYLPTDIYFWTLLDLFSIHATIRTSQHIKCLPYAKKIIHNF